MAFSLYYIPEKGKIEIQNLTAVPIPKQLATVKQCTSNQQALKIFKSLRGLDLSAIRMRIEKKTLSIRVSSQEELIEEATKAILDSGGSIPPSPTSPDSEQEVNFPSPASKPTQHSDQKDPSSKKSTESSFCKVQ